MLCPFSFDTEPQRYGHHVKLIKNQVKEISEIFIVFD